MIYVYIVIALVALGGGGAVVWKYNSTIERAERAEAATKAANEAARQWEEDAKKRQAEVDRLQRTLAQRERDRRALQEERDHARSAIADLRKNPEARRWADVELPADVLVWVRDPAGSAPTKGELPRAAGGRARADADAAVPRADKR